MPTYRFPILIWEDYEGYFTANPLERFFSQFAGIGRTANDAVLQLREFLAHHYEKSPWTAEPDFEDARLIHLKVEVRPEYRIEENVGLRVQKNIYPAEKS